MRRADISIPGRQIRLFVDLPYPDETWASFFDRIAARYGCDRTTFVRQLYRGWTGCTDLDIDLPLMLYEALLTALGATDDDLAPGNRGVTHYALQSRMRVDYCPLCFLDDLAKKRTPYFRYQWTIPYLNTCHLHSTPLLRWRSVRHDDERILPIDWVSRPTAKCADKCPWFDEDVRFADRFSEEKLAQAHPLNVIRRFSSQIVQFTGGFPSWRLRPYEHHCGIDELVCLAASADEENTRTLAESLRPACGTDRLFGPALYPRTWEAKYAANVWGRSVDVAYRRSIMWFVAKNIVGSAVRTKLVGEVTAPAGAWKSWWPLVSQLAPNSLRERLCVEEKRMAQMDEWREMEKGLKRAAALERLAN